MMNFRITQKKRCENVVWFSFLKYFCRGVFLSASTAEVCSMHLLLSSSHSRVLFTACTSVPKMCTCSRLNTNTPFPKIFSKFSTKITIHAFELICIHFSIILCNSICLRQCQSRKFSCVSSPIDGYDCQYFLYLD